MKRQGISCLLILLVFHQATLSVHGFQTRRPLLTPLKLRREKLILLKESTWDESPSDDTPERKQPFKKAAADYPSFSHETEDDPRVKEYPQKLVRKGRRFRPSFSFRKRGILHKKSSQDRPQLLKEESPSSIDGSTNRKRRFQPLFSLQSRRGKTSPKESIFSNPDATSSYATVPPQRTESKRRFEPILPVRRRQGKTSLTGSIFSNPDATSSSDPPANSNKTKPPLSSLQQRRPGKASSMQSKPAEEPLSSDAPANVNNDTKPRKRLFLPISPLQQSRPEKASSTQSQPSEELPSPNPSANTNNPKPRKRRFKRAADYPSFSYTEADPRVREYQQKLVRLKYKGCGMEDIEFQQPSTEVVIPDKGPLVNSLAMEFFGGFESGLGEIGISALKTRLLKNRSYAKKEPFALDNRTTPPSLADLAYPPSAQWKGFWVTAPARILTAVVAYFIFPYLTSFFESFVTMPSQDLDAITSKFGPGISIVYGTFISLTLSISYNRVKDIQDAAARESALLTLVTRNLLTLCQTDPESAVEAAQCCADQIRTMVKCSRGRELLLVMYSDPYARMLEVLDYREEELLTGSEQPRWGNSLGNCRDSLKTLITMRAERLSMEALSLPPTHFQIMTLLTFLILLSFIVSILPNVDRVTGAPPNEASIIFAILTNVYILFYFFVRDLNNPFDGVYQIRRSSSAVHLLEAKWLIANHPLTRDRVDFEEVVDNDCTCEQGVAIVSPGLGEMYFEANDLFCDGIASTKKDDGTLSDDGL